MSSRYRYCGLTLESRYPLPELEVADAEIDADIHIHETRLGSIPSDLEKYGPNWAVGPREGWWWLKNRVFFRIRPGIIEIDPGNAEDSLVRALLLEGPMVMAMIFNDSFCLNAASVAHNGNTIVFCGASGSGRSTAAARLAVQGGRILSDSLARIDVSSINGPSIHPQGSGTLLWPHALVLLGLEDDSGMPVRRDALLRRVKLASVTQPEHVDCIYWRNPHPGTHRVGDEGDEGEQLPSTRQRFARLAAITAGRLWIEPAARSTAHFQWCIDLARNCQMTPAPGNYFY